MPNTIVNVVWGWHTIVDAQINCMENLLEIRHTFPWKYILTLCGKEVPLRTKRDGREIDEVEWYVSSRDICKFEVWILIFLLRQKKFKLWKNTVVSTNEKLGPVPSGFTIVKSVAYYGLSTAFVDYILHNKEANAFRKFMDDTLIPDEHFVATLFNKKGKHNYMDCSWFRIETLYPVVKVIAV